MNRLISRALSTTKSRLALIEKDAIIHVSWNTPSKKIGVAHSKYGEVIVKEVRPVEIIFEWEYDISNKFLKVIIAKPPDENLSSNPFDFVESLGNGEKIKCDIETVQGRLTATNVFKADGNFILMPHNRAYNYRAPVMDHGNRKGQNTVSYSGNYMIYYKL